MACRNPKTSTQTPRSRCWQPALSPAPCACAVSVSSKIGKPPLFPRTRRVMTGELFYVEPEPATSVKPGRSLSNQEVQNAQAARHCDVIGNGAEYPGASDTPSACPGRVCRSTTSRASNSHAFTTRKSWRALVPETRCSTGRAGQRQAIVYSGSGCNLSRSTRLS